MPVVALDLSQDSIRPKLLLERATPNWWLGRTIIFDPNWPWHAAEELGGKVRVPAQYLRSQPGRFRDLFANE